MKLISLLVPVNLPAAYPGATPTAYQSSVVDNFERQLAAKSPIVLRNTNIVRLSPDASGRFAHQSMFTRYDIGIENAAKLGEIVALALTTFKLESIVAAVGGKTGPLTANDAEDLCLGYGDDLN